MPTYIPDLYDTYKGTYKVRHKTIKFITFKLLVLDEVPLEEWTPRHVQEWADYLCTYYDERLNIARAERRRKRKIAACPEYALNRKATKNSPDGRFRSRAERDERIRQARPAWADTDAMVAIYRECYRISKETGIKHHVDHIVPLVGKHNGVHVVCGLHCEANFQIVPASDNLKKGCRFNQKKE